MANENEQYVCETLADIVAEMRTRSREVKVAFGGRPDGVENMLDIWADRIEALAKRDDAAAKKHRRTKADDPSKILQDYWRSHYEV